MEADQLAIHKHHRGIELGLYRETTPAKCSDWDLNPRPQDFNFGALTTRLRFLLLTFENEHCQQTFSCAIGSPISVTILRRKKDGDW